MIAANVGGPWERSCLCFVDAGIKALGSREEVYLVVNLPTIRACQVAVLDNLWGWRVFARVSR